jgi:hypothetical protein
VLAPADPAGLGRAGRVPVGITMLRATGLADGGGAGRPGRGGGRVGGKPGQHRRDRLGLRLRKAAAGLTAKQLHLVGGPWRPGRGR